MSDQECVNKLKEVREKLIRIKDNFSQPDENDKNSAEFFKQAAVEWMKVICDAQHEGKYVKQELFNQIRDLITSIIEKNIGEFLKEIKRSFFAIDINNNNCLQNAMISMYGILMPTGSQDDPTNVFPKKMVGQLLKNAQIKEKIKTCFKNLLLSDGSGNVLTVASQVEVLYNNEKMMESIAKEYLELNFPDKKEQEVIKQSESTEQKGGGGGGGVWRKNAEIVGQAGPIQAINVKLDTDTRAKTIYGSNFSDPNNEGLEGETLKAVNYVRTPPKTVGGLSYTNAELLGKVRVDYFNEKKQDTYEPDVIGQMKGGMASLLYDKNSSFHIQVQNKLLHSIGQLVERAAQEPKKTANSAGESNSSLSILELLKQKFAESLENHFDIIMKEDFAYTNLFYFGLSYTPTKEPPEKHREIIHSNIHLAISQFLDSMRSNLYAMPEQNIVINQDAIKGAFEYAMRALGYEENVGEEKVGGSNKSPKKITSIYKKYTNHFKTLKKLQHTNLQTIRQKTTSK
jgi:hypothetical protein